MSRYILINRYFHPDESATSQFLTDLARHLATRDEVVVLTSRQLLEDPAAGQPARSRVDGVHITASGPLHDQPQQPLAAGRNARTAYERCYSRRLALQRWDEALQRV